MHLLRTPVAQLPCDWHFVIGALRVNVLIACLKSLPQRTQTPDSLSTRWPLLWRREDLSWRERPGRITRTILFSRKFEAECSSSRLIYSYNNSNQTHLFFVFLLFRFLYDKSSLEYLYYKHRVADLRKDLLRPKNTSDNGKMTSSHTLLSLFFFCLTFPLRNTKMLLQKGWTVCQYRFVSFNYSYLLSQYDSTGTSIDIIINSSY